MAVDYVFGLTFKLALFFSFTVEGNPLHPSFVIPIVAKNYEYLIGSEHSLYKVEWNGKKNKVSFSWRVSAVIQYIKMNICVCVCCLFELYGWPNRSSDCYESFSTYCLHSRERYRLFSGSFLLSCAEQDH
jgi:hypothetical protein